MSALLAQLTLFRLPPPLARGIPEWSACAYFSSSSSLSLLKDSSHPRSTSTLTPPSSSKRDCDASDSERAPWSGQKVNMMDLPPQSQWFSRVFSAAWFVWCRVESRPKSKCECLQLSGNARRVYRANRVAILFDAILWRGIDMMDRGRFGSRDRGYFDPWLERWLQTSFLGNFGIGFPHVQMQQQINCNRLSWLIVIGIDMGEFYLVWC